MAEKEGFEPSHRLPRSTPLAGEPLQPYLGTSPCELSMFGLQVSIRIPVWRRERDSNPRRLAASLVFKTSSINHSDISPCRDQTPPIPVQRPYSIAKGRPTVNNPNTASLTSRHQPIGPHPFAQYLGYQHAPVRLLHLLYQRRHQAAGGEPGGV